jgi:glyoxylase-like metal-dependent hydrolase (beta-lactamase superfamily II)
LICLYERARRLLFTTDHVMRRAPAPVSVRIDSKEDPLGDYVGSGARFKLIDVLTVLPGHGRPFGGLAGRLSEIESDILAQLDAVRQRLAHGPATGYELLASKAVPDRRPIAERYALSQLLARVRHLELRGEVQRLPATREGFIRYALAQPSDYASAS